MSAKESTEKRITTLHRRIEDLTSLLEDLRSEVTTLKQRFDRLRDDHSDQLASLRGRITASERWSSRKQASEEPLTPASPEDIFRSLSESDRRILRSLLAGGASAQPSSQTTQGGQT